MSHAPSSASLDSGEIRCRTTLRPKRSVLIGSLLESLAIAALFLTGGSAMQDAHASTKSSSGSSSWTLTVVPQQWPPVVHIRLRLASGAFADPTGREGLAALCWRAALRAGGGRTQAEQARRLDALGGGIAVHVGRQDTLIEGTTLASELTPFLTLLADTVLRPRLAKSDIDYARLHQLADITARFDDDGALAHEALVRFAHRDDAAGRPTDGDATTLPTITPADCVAYHRDVLRAATVHVGFAGAIDEAGAKTALHRHFGPLLTTRATPTLSANRAMIAPQVRGRRLLILDHPGRKQATVMLGLPTIGATHSAQLALQLADAVIGGAFSSRLNLRIREQRGWTYSLQSYLRLSQKTGMWTISWTPSRDVAARSIDLAMRIIELAHKDGVSAAEVTFGKGFLKGAQRYDADTAQADLDMRMHASALGLGSDWQKRYTGRVDALSTAAVSAACRHYMDAGHVVAVVVGDARVLGPALRSALAGFAIEILPYRSAPNGAKVVGATQAITPGPSTSGPSTPGPSTPERSRP